jgi:hypothetical protein
MKSEDEAKQPQPLGQEGDDLEVEDVWVADMGVKVEGSEEEIMYGLTASNSLLLSELRRGFGYATQGGIYLDWEDNKDSKKLRS